jgi:hypothetical protein
MTGRSFTRAEFSRAHNTVLRFEGASGCQEIPLQIDTAEAWTTVAIRIGSSQETLPVDVFGEIIANTHVELPEQLRGSELVLLIDGQPCAQRLAVPTSVQVVTIRAHRQSDCNAHLEGRTWKHIVTLDVVGEGTGNSVAIARSSGLVVASADGVFVLNHTQIAKALHGERLIVECDEGFQTADVFDTAVSKGWLIPCFGLRGGMHRVALLEGESTAYLPLGECCRDLGNFQLELQTGDVLGVVDQQWLTEPLSAERVPLGRLSATRGGTFRLRIAISGSAGLAGLLANIVLDQTSAAPRGEPAYVGDPFVDYSGQVEPFLVVLDQ